MLSNILLRTVFKTEICAARMIQSLSINNNTSTINKSLQLGKDNSSIQNVNKEIIIHNKIPYIEPKTVSSSYINESEILQELFKLNVDLYKVEKNVEAYKYILQRNFDDIKEHIIFLKELNLENADIGRIITKNSLIFKEDLDDLKVRINYLKFKRFTDDMITAIIKKNPFWLSHSTEKIDECLGSIQNLLGLKSNELRELTTKYSKAITYPLYKMKINTFALKEEMGFSKDEMKQIILQQPKLLLKGRAEVLKTFDYLHNSMHISHKRLVQECGVLNCRENRLKQRHLFLEKLGRAQYDPKKPNYVSLKTLVVGTDLYFSTEVAKSSINAFNLFLKSL